MNGKWLIILDVDGTLLKGDGITLPQNNIDTIRRLVADGHIVCINTGRGYYGVKEIYKHLNLKHLTSCFAGGYIFSFHDKSIKPQAIYFDGELVMNLLKDRNVENKVKCFAFENEKQTYINSNHEQLYVYTYLEFKPNYKVIDINDLNKYKFNTFFIEPTTPENAEELIEFFNSTNYFNVYRIPLAEYFDTSTTKVFVELNNKKINKGHAVKYFQSFYQIDNDRTICFGDSSNDISMFKKVTHSVAMKNSKKDIKKYCKHVTKKTSNEGGVGDFLNTFFYG